MVTRLVAGTVLGAALTVLGLWLAPPAPPSIPPVTQRPPVDVVWVERDEARIGNAVVISRGLRADGTRARLDYDVISLTSSGGDVRFGDGGGGPTTVPATFTAVLTSGAAIDAVLASPNARSVAFDLPADAALTDVAAIRVTRWKTRIPFHVEVRLPSEVGAAVDLPDGSTITLDTVLEQRNGTVMQFDFDLPPGYWQDRQGRFGPTADFSGAGDGWRLGSATLGLEAGFQLTWAGATAPAEIVIDVRLAPWHTIAADVPVPFRAGG